MTTIYRKNVKYLMLLIKFNFLGLYQTHKTCNTPTFIWIICLKFLKLINTDSIITFSWLFCFNLDINFYFFHNYPVLHKSLPRPQVRPHVTLIWGRDLRLGTTGIDGEQSIYYGHDWYMKEYWLLCQTLEGIPVRC